MAADELAKLTKIPKNIARAIVYAFEKMGTDVADFFGVDDTNEEVNLECQKKIADFAMSFLSELQ